MCDSKSNSVGSCRPVCQFFASGKCARGRYCRYRHMGERVQDDLLNCDVSGLDGSFERGSRMTSEPSNLSFPGNKENNCNRPVCNHFLHKGWCKFGRACKYSHAIAQSKQSITTGENQKYDTASAEYVIVAEGEIKAESLSQGKACLASSSNDYQNIFPNSRKLCKFFKTGCCYLGQRCRFKHITPQVQSNPRSTTKSVSAESRTCALPFGIRGLKPVNSETSSDSGLVEDFIPIHKREVLTGEAIGEADTDGKIVTAAAKPNCLRQCSNNEVTAEEMPKDLRKIEIEQLKKRYTNAKEISSPYGQSAFQFIFACTDPDWPYDVKEISLEVVFPEHYPSDMMNVTLLDDGRLPDTVRRLLTEAMQEWVKIRFEKMKALGKTDQVFRPFLRWLDKSAEDLFTEALKEFQREKLAEISGVQFISANQLRSKYRSQEVRQEEGEERFYCSNSDPEVENTLQVRGATSNEARDDSANNRGSSAVEEEPLSLQNESVGVGQSNQSSVSPSRRGTEVILQNLQLLNYAAAIIATDMSLIISCGRCSNKSEVKVKVGQLGQVECPYCHLQQLIMFRENIAHQFSSVIGYLDLDGCEAFDLILSDCEFFINCLECSKDNKLQALSPGQQNTTWCFYCHQKLTVAANNGRFVKLSASQGIDAKKACVVQVQGRVKTVKDPAIVEGKPLPNNGTCRHFKKSFRWFRFPCCGKAYPCDHCHDEKEFGHEMKHANRMICGFCAKEQPCTNEHPCISCHANVTCKSTDHWEGGTGCRDKLKMSRGDSKKYTDSLKTVSRSSQTRKEPEKKVTKLRHV